MDWLKIANVDVSALTASLFAISRRSLVLFRSNSVQFRGVRTAVECQLKWQNELSPVWKQGDKWPTEDVAKLKKLIAAKKQRGEWLDWDAIAAKLNVCSVQSEQFSR